MNKIANHVLDSFDRAILALVQIDNQRSHASIGAEVSLSASSVRRRLAAMRDNGVIISDVSLTDPSKHCLLYTSPSPRDS